MGQWRELRLRFASFKLQVLDFQIGISREGLRQCARVAGERRAAAVRAHCRLAGSIMRSGWMIEIFVSSRTAALERLSGEHFGDRGASSQVEDAYLCVPNNGTHVSELLSRETLDSAISRASWRDVALGSFECLRSVARLQSNWRFDMKKIIGTEKQDSRETYIFNIC